MPYIITYMRDRETECVIYAEDFSDIPNLISETAQYVVYESGGEFEEDCISETIGITSIYEIKRDVDLNSDEIKNAYAEATKLFLKNKEERIVERKEYQRKLELNQFEMLKKKLNKN